MSEIQANYDKNVDMKEMKFHFKSQKLTDSTGADTGETFRRPTVEVTLPVPSIEGIIAIIEAGGKQLELLQEVVADVIAAAARDVINEKEDITQDNFPLDKITWEFIANMPKAERRGGGISKESWEDFCKDYVTVMPAITGKSVEAVTNASKIYLNKFSAVKTNKKILSLLKDQLALYLDNSPNAETHIECVKFLVEKADRLLKVSDEELMSNL